MSLLVSPVSLVSLIGTSKTYPTRIQHSLIVFWTKNGSQPHNEALHAWCMSCFPEYVCFHHPLCWNISWNHQICSSTRKHTSKARRTLSWTMSSSAVRFNYIQLFAVFWIGRNLCETCKLLACRAQRLHYFFADIPKFRNFQICCKNDVLNLHSGCLATWLGRTGCQKRMDTLALWPSKAKHLRRIGHDHQTVGRKKNVYNTSQHVTTHNHWSMTCDYRERYACAKVRKVQ